MSTPTTAGERVAASDQAAKLLAGAARGPDPGPAIGFAIAELNVSDIEGEEGLVIACDETRPGCVRITETAST